MKGIVFNLLEEVVSEELGESVWDSLLDTTGLDGAYTSVGSYDDEDLMALVSAASTALGKSNDEIVRWFGAKALPLLAARYPGFFEEHTSALSFILTLNEVIHPEVRKLFPGAYAPSFEFLTMDDDALQLSYISHRKLCSFAEGLIEGAASFYSEEVSIEQTMCAKQGGDRCVLVARFTPKGTSG
ncbi:MAG: heme NO-binding domain-containing protein [Actinomycetota bacterium]